MRALLTGAAGLTGSEIGRLLLLAGYDVTAVVRRPEARATAPAGAVVVMSDCLDAPKMGELLESHDVFVHVAGISLGPALARLPAIRAPSRVVVISSAAVHSVHRASAATYRAGEDSLRKARAGVVILRPTLIYGSRRDRNMHHVLRFARRYRFLPLAGDGRALVQPVHFEDVAAAAVGLIPVATTETFEIGASHPLTLRAASELILLAVGSSPRVIGIPFGAAYAAAAVIDRIRGSRWSEKVERTREDRTADNAGVIAATGVRPRSFADGIRQQANAGVNGF